jgi:hypothetical protein
MDKNQYDQGYRHGAASTQDQARGARDAERERERSAQEQRERWEALTRQQEEHRRLEQQQQESRRESERQEAELQRHEPPPAGTAPQKASGAKGFIGFVGFIVGAIFGYSKFPDNWIAVGICAALAAWIAAALYKLIIALVLIIVVLWIWMESENGSTAATDAPTSQSYEVRGPAWV